MKNPLKKNSKKPKDRVSVKKIIMHINKVRQDETYGKEFS
jgi:hypothetical protein